MAVTKRTYSLLLSLITVLYFLLLFLTCLGCIYLNLYYFLAPFMIVVDIFWFIACIVLLVKRSFVPTLWPKWWKKKSKYTTHDFEEYIYAHYALTLLVFELGLYFYYLYPTLGLITIPSSAVVSWFIACRSIVVEELCKDAQWRARARGVTYLEKE